MSKKWIKRIAIALSTTVVLILIIFTLLYIPAVQNVLQKRVTDLVSQSTGMDISIGHVTLRFPLDLVAKDVRIVQSTDTILSLHSLGFKVKLQPLFSGNIEAHGIFLENATVNTATLMPGMQLKGRLGRFDLDTRLIRLSDEQIDLSAARISNATLLLCMNDTVTAPQDTTEATMNWKISLPALDVKSLSFAMEMPADSMNLAVYIDEGQVRDIVAHLGEQRYGVGSIGLKRAGLTIPQMALEDINAEIDSVLYSKQMMTAVVRNFTLRESSGLSITGTSGSVYVDTLMLSVPAFSVKTPYSNIRLSAQAYWSNYNAFDVDRLTARLNVSMGRKDILLFAGDLPASFSDNYPLAPFTLQVGVEGNMDNLRISKLSAQLPGAIDLTGSGSILHAMDSINRSADIGIEMQTEDLGFLSGLGMPADSSIVIPPVAMTAALRMKGPQFEANLLAKESDGRVALTAMYNTANEAYNANLSIDSLRINHFMPRDSIYLLSAHAAVTGKGIDINSVRTTASVTAGVNMLEYGKYKITDVELTAALKDALATAHLTSMNALLVMDAWGEYRLNARNMEARASVNIADVDVHQLGLVAEPMKHTVSMSLSAEAKEDSVKLFIISGDLEAKLRAQGPMEQLTHQATTFLDELMRQIEAKELNHINLRQALPTANFSLKAGRENPVSRYLTRESVRFDRINAGFLATPERGLNGGAVIHGLHVDTLQLDTLFFIAFQDTARLNLRSGVINGPKNPQYTFRASLTGEVRSADAEVMLEFKDADGETGLKLGANIKPNNNGVRLKFIPERPIVAFRNFSFNQHNRVFIRNNGRVLADVEMLDDHGMGFRMHSLPDTTYLQNLDVEIRRVELGDISRILPYYPSFSGLFSAEAIFRQTEETMQLSTEMRIQDLFYEKKRAGNIGLAATWLPGSDNAHYVDAYLALEDTQILTANGKYQSGAQENVGVDVVLEHFPLYLGNLFVPEELIELSGDLDGEIAVEGTIVKPRIDGELRLDEVSVYSHQYGMSFNFENRPLKITNGRLTFDKFGIYTTSKNPFTIDGFVDFSNFAKARADLSLSARNYELLNAPRKDGRLLYGKVYVDLNSTVKGPLDELMMRGNLNVLSSTKVNYVLADSPLTVQDRLGDMVQFVSFADTTQAVQQQQPMTLGGLNMMMTINIGQSVKVGVDLTPDRSSFVDLEGGGNLTFQYTPQGEMILSGRYTLSDGTLKYTLPVIPLKEFSIDNGSYVEWRGDPMEPRLNFKATERMRISVPNQESDGSRTVSFDVSIAIKNTLSDLQLVFDLAAPEDSDIQRELDAMAAEERSKQAVAMMAAGIYLHRGASGGGDFDMGSAINNLLQNQLAGLAGSALKTVNISFDMENYDDAGGKRTDYNFKYAQRFFNDRVQVVIGGTISTGQDAEQTESFIDNVSLEYRLDDSGTRYVRLYHDKNYESVFEGEVTETGVGLVLRKKVNNLGELFIFRRKKSEGK